MIADNRCDQCGAELRWDDSCPSCQPDPPRDFARRMNHATREQVAAAMEALPTDALEFAVWFEAMGHDEPKSGGQI